MLPEVGSSTTVQLQAVGLGPYEAKQLLSTMHVSFYFLHWFLKGTKACFVYNYHFIFLLLKHHFILHADFDGFHDRGDNITYNVSIPSIAADRDNIALYCNISGANPPPSILWVDDLNQTMPNDGVMFLYLDAGRYLAIININAETAKRVFHCRVTNVLGLMTLDSPTQYRFNISSKTCRSLMTCPCE